MVYAFAERVFTALARLASIDVDPCSNADSCRSGGVQL